MYQRRNDRNELRDGITFNTVAGKATRTGSEATTTNSIKDFHVYAFTQGLEYMNHDVTKTGNTWTYGDTKFWPESTVDFYSYSPMDMRRGTVNITAEGEKKSKNIWWQVMKTFCMR